MKRANASIETGVIRLYNGWLDRRWAAFSGASTELLVNGHDAFTRKSPEYHLDCNGEPVAAHDMGHISWSESVDPFGATICMEQSGHGLHVRLTTFMSHGHPGIVRCLQLCNTADAQIQVTRYAAEVLPLKSTQFKTTSTPEGVRTCVDDEYLYYQPLISNTGTLWLGSPCENGFALFAPNPNYCAPVWTGNKTLEPGQVWTAPPSSLFWAGGSETDTPIAALNDLHGEWREHEQRSQSSPLRYQQN